MPFPRLSLPSDARRMSAMVAVLLLAVLAPTLCVLWFMNEAVANERLAVRQRLQEAYSGELALRQKRLADSWDKLTIALQTAHDKPPPEAFADLVEQYGLSTALIYRDGRLAYPELAREPESTPTDATNRARAYLAEAQSLLKQNQIAQPIILLATILQTPEYAAATDTSGRLIAPNAAMLAYESLPPDRPEPPIIATRLAAHLRSYVGIPISSPQRLFLMQRLRAATGEDFPTMNAEYLALSFAEIFPAPESDTKTLLPRTLAIPGFYVWSDPSAALVFSRQDLAIRFGESVALNPPPGTTLALVAPNEKPATSPFLSAPAGPFLPNWQIQLDLTGPDPFAAAAAQRSAVYFWTACLAVGTIALVGLALGAYLRRQMQLTRLKNDLIATVSHELKTPLSSMRVLVDTLLEGRIPSPQQQREYLTLIARENSRLSRLIDNFLAFSRMERQKSAFDFRTVEVADIVHSALEAMGERAAVIEVSLQPNLTLWGDADALTTVLVNLLDNAFKYSDAKKQIILIAQDLPANQNGGGDRLIQISVRDQGIGIARRHHRRIFRRFYQIDRALSRRAGGCGLGLAIVDYITRLHRGTISLTSQPSHGSTFTLLLPAAAQPLSETKANTPHGAAPAHA